jgi:hypothetical protein
MKNNKIRESSSARHSTRWPAIASTDGRGGFPGVGGAWRHRCVGGGEPAVRGDQPRFPHSIFFTSKLIFASDNWLIRMLHNQASLAVQRRLHLEGWQMVNLPMKVWRSSVATEARAGRPRCTNLKANPIAHPYRQEGKAALHIRPSMATDFLPGYHLPAGGFSRYIFQFASTITKPTTCPHRYSPNRPAQPPLHCPC